MAGMGQRLAAGQGDDLRSERGEGIHARQDIRHGDGLGDLVKFAAVGALEVAVACHHQVGEHGRPRRPQHARGHLQAISQSDAGHLSIIQPDTENRVAFAGLEACGSQIGRERNQEGGIA